MRLITCLFTAGMSSLPTLPVAAQEKETPNKIEARVDSPVELMSLIFRLAGNDEYNQPSAESPYSKEVDAHFGKLRDHAVIKLAKKLRNEHDVGFDAVMKMAVHLKDTRKLEMKVPLDPFPQRLDKRWPPGEARAFLRKARSFAKAGGFNEFFEEHRELYDAAAKRLTRELSKRDYVGWFNKFIGERPGNTKFHVVVSMLNGPCNYAAGIRYPDGREEIVAVIGAAKFDDEGVPVFGDQNVSTIAHEFCHSYTNAFVDQYADQLQPAGQRIFKHCSRVMSGMAYGNWKTMLYESLVRASVVRFLLATDGAKAAETESRDDERRGFKWIGKLAKLLGEYESQRERYPTFDAFIPRVIDFFNQYAKEYEDLTGQAPKVVRMIPANGATDVDPELTVIRVFFDRPMKDKSWAVVGGGPHYPETPGKCYYEEGCTVFVLPVKLKPDWSYQFWLNAGEFVGFMSEEGLELESVEVDFKTRAE